MQNVDQHGPLQGGVGVCLLLPVSHEQVLVRCRHIAGLVGAPAALRPALAAPPAPSASARVADDGVQLLLAGRLDVAACRQADRCQLAVSILPQGEPAGGGGEAAACEEAAVVQEFDAWSLSLPAGGEWQRRIPAEELSLNGNSAGETGVAPSKWLLRVRARLGDGLRWSPWSDLSAPFSLAVAPPRPPPGASLVVREVRGRFGVAEVSWPHFVAAPGLGQVDYLVGVAPTACPDDALEQFLPGALAGADGAEEGHCRATLQRLQPGLEYVVSVVASYPKLGRYCGEEDSGSSALCASFTTSGIDAAEFEPPPPPTQLVPPKSHGGADRRAPWGWDFWLEVDRRAVPELRGGTLPAYKAEWRPVDERTTSPSAWSPAKLAPAPGPAAELAASAPGLAVCRLDMLAQAQSAGRTSGSGEGEGEMRAPPERVELRLEMADAGAKVGTTPRLWRSCASTQWVTGFAATPKPRAELRMAAAGKLQVAVRFALSSSAPGAGQALAEWQRVELAGGGGMPPPPGHPDVPDGYGHRFAQRLQLRHRLAGDQHAGAVRELVSSPLVRETLLQPREGEDGLSCDWLMATAHVDVSQPRFKEGEKHIFAVRIGDGFRWSAWSVFSKPLQVTLPPIEPPIGGLEVALQGAGRVSCRWRRMQSALGVPVECGIWAVEVGPDDKDVRDGRQLVLLQTEGPCSEGCGGAGEADEADGADGASEPRCVVATVGSLEPQRRYRFALLARPMCFMLGPPTFSEVASTEPVVWPGDTLAVGGSAIVALESWDLPVPSPLPVPDALESGSVRWRGRAVLLAWPKGVVVSEDPPLELQACASGHQTPECWAAAPWSLLRLQERPCIVAGPLPFFQGRFRWYSRDRRIAGPRGDACLAYADPPPEPYAYAFCSTIAVRVHVWASLGHESHRCTPYCQVRFQRVDDASGGGGGVVPAGDWVVCAEAEVECLRDASEARFQVSLTFGEEDGLELKGKYVFSARVGDRCRRSQWSYNSPPVTFDVPESMLPQAGAGNELQVEALATSSVRFWWRELSLPRAAEARRPEAASRAPALEYRMDVSRCLDSGGIERHATILLEDNENGSRPFDATVHGLLPGCRYFAALACRFARLGGREWRKTGLTAAFETPRAP
mmetsp:Transcript_147067/g.472289  ORF Transcript_147067/g.472289 Transcript_147067/m.472289 type:complete len:1129 (+) Transcript_147067:3446-6832(+)